LTASGLDLAEDHITGFENLTGGSGSDVMFGSSAANVLIGNDGNDTLAGLGGADILTGGPDAVTDTFRFLKLSDSTPKAHDLITDFQQGLDKLDIDAILNSASVGLTLIEFNQFHHLAGEFRQAFSHGNTILSGDLNGDAKADFSVVLQGHYLLSAADFGF
jgi:serralysin